MDREISSRERRGRMLKKAGIYIAIAVVILVRLAQAVGATVGDPHRPGGPGCCGSHHQRVGECGAGL